MLGRLPTLVGVQGAVVSGSKPQTYKLLAIRLGGAFTHTPWCSPFWEAFGYPVEHIIYYAIPTAEEGLLTFSVPSEYCTNPIRREEVMGMSRGDQQRGALQFEFGEMPNVILRRRGGVCTEFLWYREQERNRTKGDIDAFKYDASPRTWSGESHGRADGTPHGFLVAVVNQMVGRITGSY